MKKIIFLIICILISINTVMADDGKDYVIVRLGGAFGRGGIASVYLRDFVEYRNNGLNIKYYTKEECKNDVYNYVEHQRYDDSVIIGGKTYTYEFYPEIFNLYLCTKKDMWEQVKPNTSSIDLHKKVNKYIPGEEILSKDLDDFTEKMKKCGLMHKIDADYLPTPETPVICDKYNEENPIPTKKLKDFY